MKGWLKKLGGWLLKKGIEEAEKKIAPKKPRRVRKP